MINEWPLTPVERAVAQGVMRGETQHQTCERLGITRSRYRTHIRHMMDKTRAGSQIDLIEHLRRPRRESVLL